LLFEGGEFLNDIQKIYKIKKYNYHVHWISEPNFHAMLKRRRKNNEIANKLELIFNIDVQACLYIEIKNVITKFNSKNKIKHKDYSINELVGLNSR